jgi:flavin-dependent dehydrogenase
VRKNYEVAIIGTGPSGAFAAYNLAKKGISTVIIDKETLPRYKICGGGLVYRGRKMLDFNIDEILEGEFNQVDIFVKDKDVHFTPKREMPVISMVMRDTFDELLVKKLKNLVQNFYKIPK